MNNDHGSRSVTGLPWIEMNRSQCECEMCQADPAVETELTVEDTE